jgi:beta-galactosidase
MRQRLNLNREWKFLRADATGAERADFDDSAWQPIGLPHCFDLPYFRTPEFYVGYAWYRKRFAATPGRRHYLEFDGVFQEAEVFVNGQRCGGHRGGYTGFSIDITNAIRREENLLAVRVNNNWNPQLSPRAGEHIFSGGIYRDVHVLVTGPLQITGNGVRVNTPSVSREAATVQATAEIQNNSTSSKICKLKFEITDSHDRTVAAMQTDCSIAADETIDISQLSPPIHSPQLWHPDHPHLYLLRTQLFEGDTLVDEVVTPFGFRWFEWTADRGFFLNGEHLYLRGANVHQDHAGWGIGITQAACERDVRLMKEAGFNFIRGAHYPHHPAFADACDRLGMLFWSENCFWGKGGFGPEGYWNASAYPVNETDMEPFEEHCRQTLREMIRQNRNHPSIIAWSMTNEAFFTYHLDRAKNLMSDLVRLSRELDPTRPAAIGGAQRGDVDHLGDIAGYNGDGARLFINPGVPNMVSEYGAISKPPDAYEPFFGEKQREQFPWRSGEAIWAGFDYGSIAGKQGLKGICDHFRLPKRSWHWYRDAYRGIAPPPAPVDGMPAKLRLEADKTTIIGADATDDCQIIVTVLDVTDRHIRTCPTVTLSIESGPGEFPTGQSITFESDSDIRITEGQAAIAFRSYHAGETVIRATSPGLEDAGITIVTTGEPRFVPGATPPPPMRLYIPPPESEAAKRAMHNAVNVALNRPCRASHEADGHPARYANDGDRTTAWKAADHSPAWWIVDLEGFYQLASLRLVFEGEGRMRFVGEVSVDGQKWTNVIDRTRSENVRAERNDVFPPGTVARYARFTFIDPPNLCEVEIQGILSVR